MRNWLRPFLSRLGHLRASSYGSRCSKNSCNSWNSLFKKKSVLSVQSMALEKWWWRLRATHLRGLGLVVAFVVVAPIGALLAKCSGVIFYILYFIFYILHFGPSQRAPWCVGVCTLVHRASMLGALFFDAAKIQHSHCGFRMFWQLFSVFFRGLVI